MDWKTIYFFLGYVDACINVNFPYLTLSYFYDACFDSCISELDFPLAKNLA